MNSLLEKYIKYSYGMNAYLIYSMYPGVVKNMVCFKRPTDILYNTETPIILLFLFGISPLSMPFMAYSKLTF